ncbi:MAG: hypothetical protein LV481_12740 [Methylacidiphilales bacterium]|nr:hypothetical protein [Candidatus Methylacidiphilales bacterium]
MSLGTLILPFDTGAYGSPNTAILNGITDGSVDANFAMVQGDQLSLVLYPRAQNIVKGQPTSTVRLPSGASIVVTGKPLATPGADSILFGATGFTEAQDGNGNWTYTGELNLNTTELAAAIGSNQLSIPVLLVIDIVASGGAPQRYLALITIYNQVYSGSEGTPAPATPEFLTETQSDARYAMLAPAQGSYRVKTETDGTVNLQFYNATTQLWHTLFPGGPAGAIVTNWGVGES